MLDSLAVLHTQFPHEVLYSFTGKDPKQVIFHREIKSGVTGIALPTRTAAQLIVYPP